MKNLEEIIRKNAESFDSEEPSANHFKKFLEKLDDRQAHLKRDRWIRRLTHIAAAAALVILIVSAILLHKTPAQEKQVADILSTEIKEIDMYYRNVIDMNIQEFNSAMKKCPHHKKNIQSCFRELDQSFESIKNDLKENPGDERVINALVNYYQLKLEIMEQAIQYTSEKCI